MWNICCRLNATMRLLWCWKRFSLSKLINYVNHVIDLKRLEIPSRKTGSIKRLMSPHYFTEKDSKLHRIVPNWNYSAGSVTFLGVFPRLLEKWHIRLALNYKGRAVSPATERKSAWYHEKHLVEVNCSAGNAITISLGTRHTGSP